MRPYLTLCSIALLALAANAQDIRARQPHPFPGSDYDYGYTFAPLITTPMLSLQSVSPNPVGASNATTGLVAGATNATSTDIPSGSTSSEYTVAVWYQGGAPLITPEVNTWPIAREPGMRPMNMGRMNMGVTNEDHGMTEREHAAHHEKRAEWAYFSGVGETEETTDVAAAAKGPGPGKHTYTNQDVTRQNDKNGDVHYDSKNEKIQ
ncbi:MAG: hypothetical protein WAK13_15835 [Terriglobales bacterium]